MLKPVFDRKCSQTSTELMFWLSCEVLYNLDQKHMQQGCYIGNTTESVLQCGVLSPFSFLLFLFGPRLLSHSRFVSICAGAEGRTFSSCLCWGRHRGRRKAYDRRMENDTRGTWITYLSHISLTLQSTFGQF